MIMRLGGLTILSHGERKKNSFKLCLTLYHHVANHTFEKFFLLLFWMNFCIPLHGTDAGGKFGRRNHNKLCDSGKFTRIPSNQHKTKSSY